MNPYESPRSLGHASDVGRRARGKHAWPFAASVLGGVLGILAAIAQYAYWRHPAQSEPPVLDYGLIGALLAAVAGWCLDRIGSRHRDVHK